MEIKKEETKEKVVHRQRDRTISKKGDSTIKKFDRRSKSALGLGASIGADKVSDHIEGGDDIKAVIDLERDVAVGTASKVKKTKDAVSKIRKRSDITKKEVDLAEKLGIILKSMSKEDGRKVINILLSIKETIDGGDK